MIAEKKRALLNLKNSHLEQIQQHVSDLSDRRSEKAIVRKAIVRDQDTLDQQYQAREIARKQQTLAHNAVREKLACLNRILGLPWTHWACLSPCYGHFLENCPADPQQ